MTRSTILALTAAAALALTACGAGDDPLATGTPSASEPGTGAITVGSANFSESVLLAEIYAGALRAEGIEATTRTNIGSREVYLRALEDGSIDLVPEYTGALALHYDPEFDETDPQEVYAALRDLLPEDLTVLEMSSAEDKDSLVVTQETAEEYDLETVADLKGVAGDLTLAAPPEFKTRPQGIPGLEESYGVEFGEFRPLTGQALVQALTNGQVDVANVFSTDPAIAVNDLVTLTDTEQLFGSQNVVPLIVEAKATESVKDTLNAVSEALTTEALTEMLRQTDIENQDPEDVAAQFLAENGLD